MLSFEEMQEIACCNLSVTSGHVNKLWLELLQEVADKEMLKIASATQITEMRRCFYAGVAAGLGELRGRPDQVNFELEMVSEVTEFGRLCFKGKA